MLAIAKSGWLVWLIRDNKRIADFLKIPRRTDRRDPRIFSCDLTCWINQLMMVQAVSRSFRTGGYDAEPI